MNKSRQNIFNGLSAHKVFLFFAVIWGIPMIFLTPPYHVPDEPNHFMGSFKVSTGNFVRVIHGDSLGGILPVTFEPFYDIWAETVINIENKVSAEDFLNASRLPSTGSDEKFFLIPVGVLHNPVSYFPQSIGVFIGRMLNLPLLITFYLGRFTNLAFWTLLIYFAILHIPFLKWWLLVLALSPMNVFLAASYSTDALTNGVVFLFLGLILNTAVANNRFINNKTFFLLTLLGVLLALLKNAYVPITLLWFIIPKSAFAGKREYFYKSGIFYGLILVFYGTNALYLNQLLNTIDYENLTGKIIGMHVVNPHKQLEFVLENPFRFLRIAVSSYFESRNFIINSYAGRFGWLQHQLPAMVIYLVVFTQFFLALTNSNSRFSISIRKKMIIALAFIATIGAFSLLMYVQFNSVGNPQIVNLQGRYFIPALPLLFLLFYNRKLLISEKVLKFVAIFAVIIFQIFTIGSQLVTYFI